MARRKRRFAGDIISLVGGSTSGKRPVDAAETLQTAIRMANDVRHAAHKDPGCPRGPGVRIKKIRGGGRLKYEIWVNKKCRHV